jgi:hypothetical protein
VRRSIWTSEAKPAKRSRTVAGSAHKNGDEGADALDQVQDGLLPLE